MSGYLKIKATPEKQELYQEFLLIKTLPFDSWPGSSVLPDLWLYKHLLYVASAKAIGIYPIIVFFHGHVLPAF